MRLHRLLVSSRRTPITIRERISEGALESQHSEIMSLYSLPALATIQNLLVTLGLHLQTESHFEQQDPDLIPPYSKRVAGGFEV